MAIMMTVNPTSWSLVPGIRWNMKIKDLTGLDIVVNNDDTQFRRLMSMQPETLVNITLGQGGMGWDWTVAASSYDDHYWPTNYGTGYDSDITYNSCKHDWVNVSFNHVQIACKHCGVDKPYDKLQHFVD